MLKLDSFLFVLMFDANDVDDVCVNMNSLCHRSTENVVHVAFTIVVVILTGNWTGSTACFFQ